MTKTYYKLSASRKYVVAQDIDDNNILLSNRILDESDLLEISEIDLNNIPLVDFYRYNDIMIIKDLLIQMNRDYKINYIVG